MSWRKFIRQCCHGSKLIEIDRFRRPFPQFTIRPYTEVDFDRCSEIYQLTEKGRFPEGVLGEFQASLVERDALYVVGELEGQVIGVGGILIHEYSDVIQTACLVFGLVDPEFHGKGYGTALLAYRLHLLSRWKKEWVVVMTSAGNGTEKFFERLGFIYSGSAEDGGLTLQTYFLRVLRSDLNLIHRNLSRHVTCIDPKDEIPVKDLKDEFAEMVADGFNVEDYR